MKSKLAKIAAGVTLLSLSAAAFASTSDCCCCVKACIDMICCL